MGQNQSTISQLVEKKKDAKEFEKAFKLLSTEKSLRQTLDCKKSKMYIDALNDECLPIVCARDQFEEFLVDVEVGSEESEVLKNGIKNKLEKHLQSEYLEELTSLLTGVLQSVLKAPIKHEVQQTHVVYANKSVIRIDYYLHFESIEEAKNVLLYYIQVGVIDIAKARPPVLIYELSRATKDDKLKEAGEALKRKADDTVHLYDAMQTLAKAARGEKQPDPDPLPEDSDPLLDNPDPQPN